MNGAQHVLNTHRNTDTGASTQTDTHRQTDTHTHTPHCLEVGCGHVAHVEGCARATAQQGCAAARNIHAGSSCARTRRHGTGTAAHVAKGYGTTTCVVTATSTSTSTSTSTGAELVPHRHRQTLRHLPRRHRRVGSGGAVLVSAMGCESLGGGGGDGAGAVI